MQTLRLSRGTLSRTSYPQPPSLSMFLHTGEHKKKKQEIGVACGDNSTFSPTLLLSPQGKERRYENYENLNIKDEKFHSET